MAHPRQIIRQAIIELVRAGATIAGQEVYDGVSYEKLGVMPAISIQTTNEKIDRTPHSGGVQQRILTLLIQCYAKGTDAANMIDEMASQIENLLWLDTSLSQKVECCSLIETTLNFADDNKSIRVGTLTFEIVYNTDCLAEDGATPHHIYVGFNPKTGQPYQADYISLNDLMEQPL